jgi:periplasmic copper chaperone A
MRNSLVLAPVLATSPAMAHVTLVTSETKAGDNFAATFRVGHGCAGSPTNALTVISPDNLEAARPQAKPGWTITMERAPASTGARVGRVMRITWSGGSLPADQFDDFTVLLRLPGAPSHLVFPALRTCGAASENWSELPAEGAKLSYPAPVSTLVP